MTVQTLVKRSQYHDSVTLMRVARELLERHGVRDAAVVMGTEANKEILDGSGLLTEDARAAGPNDLVIAVAAEDSTILAEAEKLLTRRPPSPTSAAARPRSLRAASREVAGARVAVISVAGQYAAAEAYEALRQGMHVLLFSDNVSLGDEVALKRLALQRGLLMMGPGAGTALLNGVALGFANVVPRGNVGIVSAAGTGLQEVSTLLARHGHGVSQGIGTGGRDLREEVGGLMMLAGLEALQEDPATERIILIAKPPAPAVAERVRRAVARSPKPTVVCFMGQDGMTLERAALGTELSPPGAPPRPGPGRGWIRGLFSGGTLCYEAQVVWRDLDVRSNAPLEPGQRLMGPGGHTALDLGEEEFTVGRPHPMIDMDLRVRRMRQEIRDPEVAVLVLDVVLGHGAHPDPASELAPPIREAVAEGLVVVASVTGTEADPQGRSRQVGALEAAGAVVCESNAAAARLAAEVVA